MAAPDFVAPGFYAETIALPRSEPRAISRQLFKCALSLAEAAVDFLTCAAGIFAAYFLCASLPIGAQAQPPMRQVAAISAVVAFFVVFLRYRDAAYRGGGGLLQIRETERAIRVPVQAAILLWIVSLLLRLSFSGPVVLVAMFVVPALLILEKQIFLSIVRGLQRRKNRVDRVVVYGAGDPGRSVLSALIHSPRLGLQPVAVIDQNPAPAGACMLEMGYRATAPFRCSPDR